MSGEEAKNALEAVDGFLVLIKTTCLPENDGEQLKKLFNDYHKAVGLEYAYNSGYADVKSKYERPQGEWIKWNFKDLGAFCDWEYKCSNCGKVYGGEYNFCPNCGVKMKGGAK